MINWNEIRDRFVAVETELLSSPSLDISKRNSLQKERSRLKNLLSQYESVQNIESEISKHKEQLSNIADPELLDLFKQEISSLENKLILEKSKLENLLYPADPIDEKSVFIEIRAGTGGQEAALFAADLMKMYTNYALKKNWKVSIVDLSQTDLKGFREVILHIEGKNVYAHLKNESGAHRVQRVPQTETSGRVHTSTATVAVLPEVEDEGELTINPADLRIDYYRAGGAGGQHVNKTDSAVRITHLPTGVVVACQEERSQHKNKAKAMKVLQARLSAAAREKQEAELSQKRKELVGTGMRSEKVRTYNFPQNRVTDHQVNITLNKLDRVIEGDLDEIIDALILKDKQERIARV